MIKTILFVLILLTTQLAIANDNASTTIARLQIRTTDRDLQAIAQSIYKSFSNGLYFLETYEYFYQHKFQFQHLDLYLGSKTKRLIDWVIRSQTYTHLPTIISAGIHIELYKSSKLTSFIEIFPLKTNAALGRYDLIHYYTLPVYKKIYARGVNQLIIRPNQPWVFTAYVDVIYPINKHIDFYIRPAYSNNNELYFGPKGFTNWVGIRFNF